MKRITTKEDLREMLKKKEINHKEYREELRELTVSEDDSVNSTDKKQIEGLNNIAKAIASLQDNSTHGDINTILKMLAVIQAKQEQALHDIMKRKIEVIMPQAKDIEDKRPRKFKMEVTGRDNKGLIESITFEAVE